MLEALLNVFDAIVWAGLWAGGWFLIAAICLLALAGLAYLLRPFGLVLTFIWNVGAELRRMHRARRTRSSPR